MKTGKALKWATTAVFRFQAELAGQLA